MDKAVVGMYGVYYVASQLCLLGYNVATTSRNAKMVDIIVQNPDTGKATGLQVKTLHKQRKKIEDDYFNVKSAILAKIDEEKEVEVPFVFVYIQESIEENVPKTRCFVVPKEDVLKLCKEYLNWYKKTKKPKKPKLPLEDLGRKREYLSIGIWQLEAYENRWDKLGLK